MRCICDSTCISMRNAWNSWLVMPGSFKCQCIRISASSWFSSRCCRRSTPLPDYFPYTKVRHNTPQLGIINEWTKRNSCLIIPCILPSFILWKYHTIEKRLRHDPYDKYTQHYHPDYHQYDPHHHDYHCQDHAQDHDQNDHKPLNIVQQHKRWSSSFVIHHSLSVIIPVVSHQTWCIIHHQNNIITIITITTNITIILHNR